MISPITTTKSPKKTIAIEMEILKTKFPTLLSGFGVLGPCVQQEMQFMCKSMRTQFVRISPLDLRPTTGNCGQATGL